jgi:hypothetical protein
MGQDQRNCEGALDWRLPAAIDQICFICGANLRVTHVVNRMKADPVPVVATQS